MLQNILVVHSVLPGQLRSSPSVCLLDPTILDFRDQYHLRVLQLLTQTTLVLPEVLGYPDKNICATAAYQDQAVTTRNISTQSLSFAFYLVIRWVPAEAPMLLLLVAGMCFQVSL